MAGMKFAIGIWKATVLMLYPTVYQHFILFIRLVERHTREATPIHIAMFMNIMTTLLRYIGYKCLTHNKPNGIPKEVYRTVSEVDNCTGAKSNKKYDGTSLYFLPFTAQAF